MPFILSQYSTGSEAVKKLRKKKLQEGHPFMINAAHLPAGQCYLEYPSGSIKLAIIVESKRDLDILKELDNRETLIVRKKYNLY